MAIQLTYAFDLDKCGTLENLINKERKKKNLKPLKCDYSLYYVAWWHTKDQNDYVKNGGTYNKTCNVHSWKLSPGQDFWKNYSPCCFDLRCVNIS